jgi:hypothetical protein
VRIVRLARAIGGIYRDADIGLHHVHGPTGEAQQPPTDMPFELRMLRRR